MRLDLLRRAIADLDRAWLHPLRHIADEIDVGDSLGLKKGGVWALAFDDHRLVGAERLPPPKTE